MLVMNSPYQNTITILLFATLKDLAGTKKESFQFEGEVTIGTLKLALIDRFPSLSNNLENILVSINQKYAFQDDIVPDGAEVAFFPPVSGGHGYRTIARIVDKPFDHGALLEQIIYPETGAICSFIGVVRGNTYINGKTSANQGNRTQGSDNSEIQITHSLEYEAYIPMAEEKMEQVAQEIRHRWPSVQGIGIIQLVGRMAVGTPTVYISCTAAHRNTGVFDAAQYGIDRLKEIVPVWKKEIASDSETWVEGEYYPKNDE
jgi:MoaE-MoaD fusion protein